MRPLLPGPGERDSFSITELARVFGLSVQAVHQWIRTGRIRSATRRSRRGPYRIPRAELIRLLKDAGREVPGLWSRPRTKLLLIDDDGSIRRLIESAFEDSRGPVEARTASNPEDGLVLAARFEPDVILLDSFFGKRRLTARQTVAFIRTARLMRGARVVVMSPLPSIGRELVRVGADAFLLKPFGIEELRKAVLPRRLPRD